MKDKEVLRIADIMEMLSISKSTVFRWNRDKILPKPLYIGNRVLGWRKSTILEWLESLEEAA
ncbi:MULTISPECIES: helix-turn-helix transcriptional regulator [unclassified Pseudoalteromonas]|uniref:helix-turn-helix transcriptional regulator n=1 Tax=unclassified Pseudoalteromonas TaxID=194690 RepID=UPI0004914679|nr:MULTISPECIES: AlpA family phage regulatory protein [unclassified Pseudoalteromonas]